MIKKMNSIILNLLYKNSRKVILYTCLFSFHSTHVDAQQTDIPFNPNIKDGRSTKNLQINKSNWANTLDTPPYEAYAVTCGITFSFGGLKINTEAQVISSDGAPIPGLYAAGELVGGIFYFNYPGGTGLTNGSVFGRIAGTNAALVDNSLRRVK